MATWSRKKREGEMDQRFRTLAQKINQATELRLVYGEAPAEQLLERAEDMMEEYEKAKKRVAPREAARYMECAILYACVASLFRGYWR